jgi:hypothetical protein
MEFRIVDSFTDNPLPPHLESPMQARGCRGILGLIEMSQAHPHIVRRVFLIMPLYKRIDQPNEPS